MTAAVPVHFDIATEEGKQVLVQYLEQNDQDAITYLHNSLCKGLQYYFYRQLRYGDIEDCVHDTLMAALRGIQAGHLERPAALLGYIRTIACRTAYAVIEKRSFERNRFANLDASELERTLSSDENVEEDVAREQMRNLVRETLGELSDRDRDILHRFYVLEQPQAQICAEMGLSETQFRLLKSRAKARFGELGKRRLHGHRRVRMQIISKPEAGVSCGREEL